MGESNVALSHSMQRQVTSCLKNDDALDEDTIVLLVHGKASFIVLRLGGVPFSPSPSAPAVLECVKPADF